MTHIEDHFAANIGWLYDNSELIGEPYAIPGGDFAFFSVSKEGEEPGVIACIAHQVEPDRSALLTVYRSHSTLRTMGDGSFSRGLAAIATDSIAQHTLMNRK